MDIYITYGNNPSNPESEYQKRGKVWYKRKKGSTDLWKKVESKYYDYLNSTFNVKLFNNIKPLYRFGVPVVAIIASYALYKRFTK